MSFVTVCPSWTPFYQWDLSAQKCDRLELQAASGRQPGLPIPSPVLPTVLVTDIWGVFLSF